MISVVMPVYNGEKYLAEAVQSIVGQTYTDWELIIVNDGSTDSSGAIAGSFAANDGRITVVTQANAGLSAARNAGVARARGEYVYFIDCDDIAAPNSFEILLQPFENSEVDLAIGAFATKKQKLVGTRFCASAKVVGNKPTGPSGCGRAEARPYCRWNYCDSEEIAARSLYQRGVDNGAWGKLYRAGILRRTPFTEGILYEDLDFFYRYCLQCRLVAWTTARLYYYRPNPAGIMKTWSVKRLDVLAVVERIVAYMEQHRPALIPAARERQLSANFNMLILALRRGDEETVDYCWSTVRKYRWKVFLDPHIRFKSRVGIMLSYLGKWALTLCARG